MIFYATQVPWTVAQADCPPLKASLTFSCPSLSSSQNASSSSSSSAQGDHEHFGVGGREKPPSQRRESPVKLAIANKHIYHFTEHEDTLNMALYSHHDKYWK